MAEVLSLNKYKDRAGKLARILDAFWGKNMKHMTAARLIELLAERIASEGTDVRVFLGSTGPVERCWWDSDTEQLVLDGTKVGTNRGTAEEPSTDSQTNLRIVT